MNPLGENIAALRAANGWTLQELAANVRRCGAPKVQHQHLQQLEAKPNTRPRYLIELACAFGKTVEELRAWQSGMPHYGPNNSARSVPRVEEGGVHAYLPLLTPDEQSLIDAYRQCNDDVQKAALTLIHAARTGRPIARKHRT